MFLKYVFDKDLNNVSFSETLMGAFFYLNPLLNTTQKMKFSTKIFFSFCAVKVTRPSVHLVPRPST